MKSQHQQEEHHAMLTNSETLILQHKIKWTFFFVVKDYHLTNQLHYITS